MPLSISFLILDLTKLCGFDLTFVIPFNFSISNLSLEKVCPPTLNVFSCCVNVLFVSNSFIFFCSIAFCSLLNCSISSCSVCSFLVCGIPVLFSISFLLCISVAVTLLLPTLLLLVFFFLFLLFLLLLFFFLLLFLIFFLLVLL